MNPDRIVGIKMMVMDGDEDVGVLIQVKDIDDTLLPAMLEKLKEQLDKRP